LRLEDVAREEDAALLVWTLFIYNSGCCSTLASWCHSYFLNNRDERENKKRKRKRKRKRGLLKNKPQRETVNSSCWYK